MGAARPAGPNHSVRGVRRGSSRPQNQILVLGGDNGPQGPKSGMHGAKGDGTRPLEPNPRAQEVEGDSAGSLRPNPGVQGREGRMPGPRV